MSLDVFRAVIQGYSDRMFDMQVLAVHQGYWSGYYNKVKKPKSMNTILQKMLRARDKVRNTNSAQPHTDEVDVATFLERERKRLSKPKV